MDSIQPRAGTAALHSRVGADHSYRPPNDLFVQCMPRTTCNSRICRLLSDQRIEPGRLLDGRRRHLCLSRINGGIWKLWRRHSRLTERDTRRSVIPREEEMFTGNKEIRP